MTQVAKIIAAARFADQDAHTELKSMFGANIPNFEPRIVNLRELAIPGQIRGFVSEPALYMLAVIWSSSGRMLERLFRISASMSFTDRSDLIPRTVD